MWIVDSDHTEYACYHILDNHKITHCWKTTTTFQSVIRNKTGAVTLNTKRVKPGKCQKAEWIQETTAKCLQENVTQSHLGRSLALVMMEPTKIGSLKKIFDVGGGQSASASVYPPKS